MSDINLSGYETGDYRLKCMYGSTNSRGAVLTFPSRFVVVGFFLYDISSGKRVDATMDFVVANATAPGIVPPSCVVPPSLHGIIGSAVDLSAMELPGGVYTVPCNGNLGSGIVLITGVYFFYYLEKIS